MAKVPDFVIELIAAPAPCEFGDILLLSIGWPLGDPYETTDDARQYVRDPGNRYADRTLASFEPSVAPPADAVFTGYRYGTDELWISPTTVDSVVYLVRGGVVEQWPRAKVFFGCA